MQQWQEIAVRFEQYSVLQIYLKTVLAYNGLTERELLRFDIVNGHRTERTDNVQAFTIRPRYIGSIHHGIQNTRLT